MKFNFKSAPIEDLTPSTHIIVLIDELLRRKETITKKLVSPLDALHYVAYVNKRVPELEVLITNSSSDIRSEYLSLLNLIKTKN